jgi:MFS transporter, DHA1 family, tetracycline resistance protein
MSDRGMTAAQRSPMAVLCAAVLVDMLGFGIVIPVLPFYALEFGATPLEVTVLIASFSAAQLLASPLWGRVSDRRGRRPLIIAGLFASAVSYLIFGLAGSLAMLLLSRMAAGAAGGTISVAHAYVADTTRGSERARAMGLIGAAAGIGVMIGPMIGGFFSRFGLGAPGFVAAALCAANGVAAIFLLPESRPRRAPGTVRTGEAATLRGWLSTMVRYPLSLLLSVYFLAITSFAAMTALLALYLEARFQLGAQDMGVIFAIAGGTTVIVRGVLLGVLVRRIGEAGTARLGTVGLASAMVAMAFLPGPLWMAVVVPLYAFGAGTLFPALSSLVSRATDAESQGSVLGGKDVVGGTGRVLGPLWGGLVFQQVSIGSPFLVGASLVGCAFLLALRIPAAIDREEESPEAMAASAASRAGRG